MKPELDLKKFRSEAQIALMQESNPSMLIKAKTFIALIDRIEALEAKQKPRNTWKPWTDLKPYDQLSPQEKLDRITEDGERAAGSNSGPYREPKP